MTTKVKGWIRNLDTVLCDILSHYVPNAGGVDSVSDAAQVTLPLPDWAQYPWMSYTVQTLAIGESALEVIYTVPDDMRLWLDNVVTQRNSGDNNAFGIAIIPPAAYFTGAAAHHRVIQLVTADPNIFWPDPGGLQPSRWVCTGPQLLEPGTAISLDPDGSGSSETIFRSWVRGRAMKLTRARTP